MKTSTIRAAFIPLTLVTGIALSWIVSQDCGGKTPTPGQITNAIITCTETVCTAQATSPECAQLESAIMSCLVSDGNLATCLAGIPSLVGVGYADVVCIIATLASPPESSKYNKSMATIDVSQKAADWLKTQRITVRQ